VIRSIAGIARSKNRSGCPRSDFLEGGRYVGIPVFERAHRSGGDHAIDTFRDVEDDVDAATPVDAQNAPTGVWKSRKEREIPTAPTSIISFLRSRTTKKYLRKLSTESDHPHDAVDRRSLLAANAGIRRIEARLAVPEEGSGIDAEPVSRFRQIHPSL